MRILLTHWGRYKMTAISRRYFQIHFLEWKCVNFDWNLTEVCSYKGPTNKIPALVQIMVWHRPGDKPLIGLLTHKCATLLQWVNGFIYNRTRPNHVHILRNIPDSKVHGGNMGPTWVLSAPDGPPVGPMNLAIKNTVSAQHEEVMPLKPFPRHWRTLSTPNASRTDHRVNISWRE